MLQLPEDYSEVLIELGQILYDRLASALPEADAERLARAQLEAIRKTLGGNTIYITKGTRHDIRARHVEIWKRHRQGATMRQLAERYGVAVATIYDILAQQRDAQQHKLF